MRIGDGATSDGTAEGAAVDHKVSLMTPVVEKPVDTVSQIVVADDVTRTRCKG